MPRKPIQHGLPRLAEVFPDFRGFATTDHLALALATRLRQAIDRLRRPQTHPFYGHQEAARFFGVSLWTVARVYKQLEAEGLLSVVRGAGTRLHGRQLAPRRTIKGVVGLVIDQRCFTQSPGWRSFFGRLDNELNRHSYVMDYIFYQAQEQSGPTLTDRILDHGSDLIVWLAPDAFAPPHVRLLQDRAIPVVLIGDGKIVSPPQQYLVDLKAGAVAGLKQWRAQGVRRVAVIGWGDSRDSDSWLRNQAYLTDARLDASPVSVTPGNFRRRLRPWCRQPATGVVLGNPDLAQELADRDPAGFRELCQQTRVLIYLEWIRSREFAGHQVRVDAVMLDYQGMARRVAQDISEQRLPAPARPVVFRTRWRAQADLGRVPYEAATRAEAYP